MTVQFKPDAQGRPSMPKRIGAAKDYTFKFTDWLALVTDTINSHEITVDTDSGIVCNSSVHNENIVTAWISGGIAFKKARVTCKIVTVGGRTEYDSIYLDLVPN
jgi:hypothetical protein